MNVNHKDVASGAIFAAVGLAYGTIALTSLPIGRALNMGPGYFPIVLSSMLVLLGAAIAGRGFARGSGTGFGAVPWRGLALLSAATVCFAAFVEQLGLFPAVLTTAFLASMANPQMGLLRGLIIAAAIAACCSFVFSYGLKLPLPVLGPLFS